MNIEQTNIHTLEAESSTTRNPRSKLKPLCIISCMALGLGLISCVGTAYDGNEGAGTTYHSTGYQISSLPSGYRTESISGNDYYYHDGYYYQPASTGYTVVSAPSTSRYYDDYSRARKSYTTRTHSVGPQNLGAQQHNSTQIISRLPSGYREVDYRGDTYYRAGDSYYKQQSNGYVIVRSPF